VNDLRPALLSIAILASLAVSFTTPGRPATPATRPDAPFAAEIRKFEEADAASPPAPGGVLFVGSSSIRLWTTLADDFPGVPVINRGFGGSRIAHSTRYADRIVIPYKPRTIVFYAGDNDLAGGLSPEQVLADYKAFVATVRAALPETRILFISIKPSTARWKLVEQIREANRLVRAVQRGRRKPRLRRRLHPHARPRRQAPPGAAPQGRPAPDARRLRGLARRRNPRAKREVAAAAGAARLGSFRAGV
jgi:hypothetical protein